jgi:putative tricarboxylic transport membrane protein
VKLSAPDLWTGLMLIALAGAYYAAADTISDSLLSDTVGAAGLPKLLAVALGLCGALLAVRSQGPGALRVKLDVAPRAVALTVLLAAYVAVLPSLGYALGMGVLIAAIALLAGARSVPALAVTAVAAGIGFWLIFVRLFHITMPAGILAGWM